MGKHKTAKAEKILNLLNTTTYGARQIAKAVGCTPAYVWALKKQMAHRAEELVEDSVKNVNDTVDSWAEFTHALTQGRQRKTAAATQEGGDHYKRLGIEPWDVFDTWPIDQQIGAYRANCTKYVMRLGHKDSTLLDAKKLRHYATKLVEVLERAA